MDAALSAPEGCLPFESPCRYGPWFERSDPLWMGFGVNPRYRWHTNFEWDYRRILTPRGPAWAKRRVPKFTDLGPKALVPAKGEGVRGRVERIAAVLAHWSVLTTQQIGAIADIDKAGTSRTLRSMMEAGVVERSIMASDWETAGRTNYLWRLRVGSPEYRDFINRLDDGQKHAVLWNVEGTSGGHDRHDVVAGELGIRAAEVVPGLQAVLGERLASATLLLPDRPQVRQRGDLVLVRDDGLQIVFEITTQPGIPQVREKMAAWGKLLGERGGPNATGIVVVFVAATSEETASSKGGSLKVIQGAHDRALVPEAMGGVDVVDPNVVAAARASVFVAHWKDWFPQQWFIHRSFADVRVHYALQPGSWSAVNLNDQSERGLQFRPHDSQRNWQQVRALRSRNYMPFVPPWTSSSVCRRAEYREAA